MNFLLNTKNVYLIYIYNILYFSKILLLFDLILIFYNIFIW